MGKEEDIVACLRGLENRGAEKEKDLELPEKGRERLKVCKRRYFPFMAMSLWQWE